MIEPPKEPSKLIRLALKDLEACQKDKDYIIRMSGWHYPVEGKCHVCLAGAVISQTLGGKKEVDLFPNCFPLPWASALWALDFFRRGAIEHGLLHLNILLDSERSSKVPRYVSMPLYPSPLEPMDEENRADRIEKFMQEMNKLVDLLESHGL